MTATVGPLPQPELIGQTIGNYLVTQKLGEGGMGSVYLAEHPQIGKKVALKVLHAELSANREVAARFFNEAKAVNDIQHPNIVDIIDFGIIQGHQQLVYFIMEYIAGETLAQLIRREAPLPPERALTIALQIADALSASHRCGIVHRDLKPDNVIIQQRPRERDFVKILDFGIAKLTTDQQSHTRTGLVMGTPAYMSPEQCEGRGALDQRTDIYALGVVLYEMLVGRVPFIGEAYGDILVQHLTQQPRPPSQYRAVNPHVEAVVMKALEKRPELRFPSMDELIRAMTDPITYIEAKGGIPQFMRQQLTPSTAPLPMKLTPAPMPTPSPGTLQPIQGTPYPPNPTNFGVQPRPPAHSRVGFIIAGTLVVAAAVVAILVVLSSSGKGGVQQGGGTGSDPAVQPPVTGTSNTNGTSGTNGTTPSGDKTVDRTGGIDAGSATAAVVTPADAAAPPVDAAPPHPPGPTKITLKSNPSGAAIFEDGKDTGKKTPAVIELALELHGVKLELRLKNFETRALEPIDAAAGDQTQNLDLKAKKVVPHTVPQHRGSAHHAGGLIIPGDD